MHRLRRILFFTIFVVAISTKKAMKRFLLITLTICQTFTLTAQKKNPKWIDNAPKAIFIVESKLKNGTTKTGSGFFIKDNGEAVSSYDLFRNTNEAVVVMSTGEKLQITQIFGADDLYGVIRFKVAVPRKVAFIPVATTTPEVNTTTFLLSSTDNTITEGAITEVTKINSVFNYYKIKMPLHESQINYPLLNEAGEAFALAQPDAAKKGDTYGIAIEYIQNLTSSATDLLKSTYSDIGIRKAWSTDIDEAQLALYLYASQQSKKEYLETLNDFISSFPNATDGYYSRASHYIYNRHELASSENEQMKYLDLAWNDMESAEKISKNKGLNFYNKSKHIFGAVSNDSTLNYKNWTIQFAEENIQKAIKEEDIPAYRLLEGDIAFFKGEYKKAFDSYTVINNSPSSSGLSFYLAAKCKQQLDENNYMEIITLIDSAIAKSLDADAMMYISENVQLKMAAGLYEQAVKDYDLFFSKAGGSVSEDFYYYREQAKFRAGDFAGAIKDIDMALLIDNINPVYHAEKASIYLRLQDLINAQASAEKSIEIEPEFASAYRILAISLIRQEKKSEACPHLNKAKELGDPVADRLIKEHCSFN
jgi:hypothetical protein